MKDSPKAVAAIADLTVREQYAHALWLGLPIILALSSQNLLNLADTWIVGRLGSAALGAVALSGTTNWVLSSFFMGLGAGVQAFVARRVGEDDYPGATGALNTSLLFTAVAVTPLALFVASFSGELLDVITSRQSIHSVGTPYLAIRLAGIPFVAANFTFRGYWNGLSLSKIYLRTLIFIHVSNILISYSLVFGVAGLPAMGVFGAGIGTTVSQALGTIYYCYLARRIGGESNGFLAARMRSPLRKLMRLGTPAGVQTLLFSLGFLFFFAITDRIGAQELAASQVLVTMALVSILPAVGFGLGAASLVGQSLGAQRPEDARQWGWISLRLGCAVVGVIGVTVALTAGWWMHTLIPSEPEAAAMGIPALRLVGCIMAADAVGIILSNALIGAGATRMVMLCSVATQWGLFLPLAWLFGLKLRLGLMALWGAFAAYRLLFGAATVLLWRGSRWQRIKV